MVSNTVLFFQACKEEISVKKLFSKDHIASKKPHSANKEELVKAMKRNMDLALALAAAPPKIWAT